MNRYLLSLSRERVENLISMAVYVCAGCLNWPRIANGIDDRYLEGPLINRRFLMRLSFDVENCQLDQLFEALNSHPIWL